MSRARNTCKMRWLDTVTTQGSNATTVKFRNIDNGYSHEALDVVVDAKGKCSVLHTREMLVHNTSFYKPTLRFLVQRPVCGLLLNRESRWRLAFVKAATKAFCGQAFLEDFGIFCIEIGRASCRERV